MQETDSKKEKERVFSRVLEFIHCFDNNYKPLDDAKTKADRLNKLMTTIPEIMGVMNENKLFFINSSPEKAEEVMRRLSFTPTVGSG